MRFDHCPKMDDLEAVLVGFKPNDKVIIFYEYTDSGMEIVKRLKKLKMTHAWLWSETKDPAAVLRSFQDPDGVQVLVSNSKSGSTSLNLQISNKVVFFESPSSPIVRDQAERRVRPRLQDVVYYWDFAAKGTNDERVLEYVNQGRDLKTAILEGETDPF